MATGEVYQKSTLNTDELKITQETTEDMNEMTMYQHLELDEDHQINMKDNIRESTREEELDLPMKLSHRY